MGNLEGGSSYPRIRETLRRAVEKEHLSIWELCDGNLEGSLLYRGLWETCNWRLPREGSSSMFIVLGYCPLSGHNPGLLPASLLDITPWEDISIQWGWLTVRCLGCVGQQRKPGLTFCVECELSPWQHSDIPIWVPFCWTKRMLGV